MMIEKTKRAVVFTLGCKVNQSESDQIAAMLSGFGFEVTMSLGAADLVVINSCSVTNEADKKSRQAIARAKKFNENAHIIMIGCSVEKGFKREGVMAIGTQDKVEALKNYLCDYLKNTVQTSVVTEFLPNKSRALIKIQDGCNRFCSYCIVPYLRGRSVSLGIDDIVERIKKYRGIAKEIVFAGIDISAYDDLVGLINEVGEIFKHEFRFRLGSIHCQVISREFLEAMKQNNFCEHFHLSLQSGSDSVLNRMNRHYSAAEFLDKVHLIREYFPLAAITTDIIAGFPGESEKEFDKTLDLINKAKFFDIHAFAFSAREGTKAFEMDGQLSPQIKKERANKIIELAKIYRQEFLDKCIGQTHEVFIEAGGEGYTRNYIRVKAEGKVGNIIKIKLTKENIINE